MSDAAARQIERMKSVFAAQKSAFKTNKTRPYAERKADLEKLEAMVKEKADAFAEAVSADYGRRSAAETQIAEIGFTLATAKHTRKHLRSWMADRSVPVPMTLAPGKAYIRREPKGVVGIVAPWNYPIQLALAPLVPALAAGCRVMIKPSEYTPRVADMLKETLGTLYSEDHVAVITGGPDVGQAFCDLAFDHLFYTGSTHVGRMVAQAAAKNLTPVTLELGGKSPTVIAPDFDIEEAAKTIAWGKYFNAGQTCVAPDYVLTPKGSEQSLADAIIANAGKFWPSPDANDDYTGIVSERHYKRITDMVEEARAGGATVLQVPTESGTGGNHHAFPPTVVLNAPAGSKLMTEEIFGPVLPVLGHDGLDDAARQINERDRPLALYIYTKSKATAQSFLDKTMSGGVGVNVPMLHLSVEDLPFGGTGGSGYGAYHGEEGFRTFCHERSVFHAPVWHPIRLMAPPYGKLFEFFRKLQAG